MTNSKLNILVIQADQLEQHCLRADKVYSQWAYQDIVDYRFAGE